MLSPLRQLGFTTATYHEKECQSNRTKILVDDAPVGDCVLGTHHPGLPGDIDDIDDLEVNMKDILIFYYLLSQPHALQAPLTADVMWDTALMVIILLLVNGGHRVMNM